MSGAEAGEQTPARSRVRLVATVVVVAVALGYLAFAAFYLATRITPAPDAVLVNQAPPGGVSVVFIPQRVDPERENVQGVLRIAVDPEIGSDVTVRVFPFLDVSEIVLPADQVAYERDATLGVEGEVRTYPFDRYVGRVDVSAVAGPEATPLTLDGGVLPINGLTGWHISVSDDRITTGDLTDSVSIDRSLTTRMTAIILAVLVLALGVIAIALAWSVAVGRKKPGFREATWLAATIFSVISVRNFMPGAPPIGAYMDALFIIPAILALFLSMALLVVFWLARDPDEEDT